jgi:hypothetical protein
VVEVVARNMQGGIMRYVVHEAVEGVVVPGEEDWEQLGKGG